MPGGEREVEDDERREDEEEHRGQGVPGAELEPEVLSREGDDVGGVQGERAHARTSLSVASAATRAGSCVESSDRPLARERRELGVEQRLRRPRRAP